MAGAVRPAGARPAPGPAVRRCLGAASRPAATARLLAAGGYLPVVLCGRDERLFARLSREPAALALGWVDDMPGLLAAGHALVDNAAGQTAVQALATGLPVIAHRPLPGHGRRACAAWPAWACPNRPRRAPACWRPWTVCGTPPSARPGWPAVTRCSGATPWTA